MDSIWIGRSLLPITALAFCQSSRPLLLVGEGQTLKIFDHESKKLQYKTRIFNEATIHGITCQALCASGARAEFISAIWGGRSLCVVGISDSADDGGHHQLEVHKYEPESQADDWILDVRHKDQDLAAKQPNGAHVNIVLVTAHNQLHRFTCQPGYNEDSYMRHAFAHVGSGPHSTLYSAHVIWPVGGRAFIAAGTVFGKVLLWSIDVDSPNPCANVRLHHIYTGHEGSVFGVRLSNPGNGDRMLLASCSDDRSIRVWDTGFDAATVVSSANERTTLIPGDRESSVNGENSISSDGCLAVIMGHVSRIWGVQFMNQGQKYWNLLSHGEDSTAQIWVLDSKDRSITARTFDLSHQKTLVYHSGKNLWAVAVCEQTSSEHVIASGGADGRTTTSSHSLIHNSGDGHTWCSKYTMEEARSLTNSCITEKPGKAIRELEKPREQIFNDLEGVWDISRAISSKLTTYPSGTFQGRVSFARRNPLDKAYTAEYLYSESGEFVTENGMTMKATRQYVYRYDRNTDSISVWFVKTDDGSTVDYLFHEIQFRGLNNDDIQDISNCNGYEFTGSGYHLCNEDEYSPKYSFKMRRSKTLSWELDFHVLGPQKDYTTSTRYSREIQASNTEDDLAAMDPSTNIDRRRSLDLTQDAFKAYAWISETDFLISTQDGNLFKGTTTSCQEAIGWELAGHHPLLQSSSIATSIQDLGMVFLTGMEGSIFLYQQDSSDLAIICRLPRKAGLLTAHLLSDSWYNVPSDSYKVARIGLLATCLGSSEAVVLFLTKEGTSSAVSLHHEMHLKLPKDYVVTSSCFFDLERVLILGSRSGDVAIYQLANLPLSPTTPVAPRVIHKVHGREAVTVIGLVPPIQKFKDSIHILTAGRDGKYAIHLLSLNHSDETNPHVNFENIHTGTPGLGPNLEGIYIDAANLYVWGFRSKDFVVYNETQKTETMTIECGGAHRDWAYNHHRDGNGGGKFVYTKASTCHVYAQQQASHRVYQHGGHGREIKAMGLSPCVTVSSNDSSFKRYLATGAEDTDIRIFDIDSKTEEYKCLSILTKHTTGLQALRWSPDGRYLFSAAGCEEFFVWRIRPAPLVTIGVICEAKCPLVTEEGDLRIMEFAILTIDSTSNNSEADAEKGTDYLISMVYSDSSIRIFRYETQTQAFTLLAKGKSTTHCLTQAKYIHTKHRLYLCTGSTDGHLAFWPLSFLSSSDPNTHSKTNEHLTINPNSLPSITTILTPTHRLPTHQNSIKSLLAIPLSSFSHILITAGDDNTIAITRLSHTGLSSQPHSPTPPLPLSRTQTLHIPSAHASAITGLVLLTSSSIPQDSCLTRPSNPHTHSSIATLTFASISNDQRLKTWHIRIHLSKNGVDGIDVRRGRNVHTGVADAGALVVGGEGGGDGGIGRGRARVGVWVAGVGIEGFGIEDGEGGGGGDDGDGGEGDEDGDGEEGDGDEDDVDGQV